MCPASGIIRFMRGRCDEHIKKSSQYFRIGTRPLRRKSLVLMAQRVEALIDAESDYRDSIPENLQGSRRYDAAEQTVPALEAVEFRQKSLCCKTHKLFCKSTAALDFPITAYE